MIKKPDINESASLVEAEMNKLKTEIKKLREVIGRQTIEIMELKDKLEG